MAGPVIMKRRTMECRDRPKRFDISPCSER
jgi:hypothetical protein